MTIEDLKDAELKPFRPCCIYWEASDHFTYLTRDCCAKVMPSKDLYLDILVGEDKQEDIVGMNIEFFSHLPDYLREKFKDATGVYPEDVIGGKIIPLPSAIATSRLFLDLERRIWRV